jgi:hypothetical protein
VPEVDVPRSRPASMSRTPTLICTTSAVTVMTITKTMGQKTYQHLRPLRRSHTVTPRSVRPASNWLLVPKSVQKRR